jgi:organic hydroperoxide reductase OsmC/OhrA
MTRHEYETRVVWDGNTGQGTAGYTAYERRYRVLVSGKPELAGSADPAFRGDADRHNPEDLFVAALSSCHMLSYLALCARGGVQVLAYEDQARGTLRLEPDGGGRFEQVTLHPAVHVASAEQAEAAETLHHRAHELCFIASSSSIPVLVQPVILVGSPEEDDEGR